MEERSILHGTSNPEINNLENSNIVTRLLFCCGKSPDLQIIKGESNFTYRQFLRKVNAFAGFLEKCGVFQKENPVVLVLDGAASRYIALYGTLAAGGYYLPIEPEKHNLRRIVDLIQESGCNIAIVTAEIKKQIQNEIPRDILLVDINEIPLKELGINYIKTDMSAETPAYVIYTSGSTGKPKGVVVPHRALLNMVLSMQEKMCFTPEDVGISFTAFSFDASEFDAFTYILNEVPLVVIQHRGKYVQNLEKMNEICKEYKVTLLFLSTVLAERFAGLENEYLRILSFGGERFGKTISTSYQLCNVYGLTETGIFNTWYPIQGNEKEIPVGTPIQNTDIVVIDEEENIVERGVEGEIIVLGESLGLGYKDDPEKTDARFISVKAMQNRRGCRTGDIGYVGKDGNLYYKERADKQIKISGYRIELGEIKFRCQQLDGITLSIPMVIKEQGVSILVQFYLSDMPLDEVALRKQQQERLPFYMVPMYNIRIDKVPYTTNEKVDYAVLQQKYLEMKQKLSRQRKTAQGEELTECLRTFIANILDVEKDQVTPETNFFELGGDSLKALRLQLNIHDFLGVEVDLTNVYDDFTVQNIARWIEKERKNV